jgi:branched-chain amino acid transport system substrate-binding protein
MSFINRLAGLSVAVAVALPRYSLAAGMRGVTATEIWIGQTMPYSGPLSAYGALGKGRGRLFQDAQ